jgi:deoxycytidylate deaminase
MPFDDIPAKECTDRQRYFLMCASKLAMKSCMTHKHGCVIVVGDEVIATGFNHHFTHMSHKFSMHAEMHAIHKMKRKYKHLLGDCELYVVRIAGPDSFKYSKPCKDCSSEIEKCGIKKVYFSTSNNHIHRKDGALN